ncbi:MAG: FAD/NAD(P)-binding protein [Terrimicrobiaceae bacterium]|nr:FAD/NAD(P)-binding protein [Terrimicrobiaceae bacterium]
MIAIVGGGASGAITAAQIGLQATVPCRVILFDPADHLGQGLAYGTRNLAHLLNVPAGKISALPDQPGHFLDWLNRAGNVAALLREGPIAPGDFVPRAIYGCYLASLVEEVFSHPACVATLDVRPSRVLDFIPTDFGGTIVTGDGDTEDVSHVVLALGNLPPRDPLPGRHPFFRSPRYVPLVWQAGAMAADPDGDVLLVGTGLTAVDVILALEAAGHRGKYIATSRGGRWPQPHGPGAASGDYLADRPPPATIRELVRLVRKKIEDTGSGNWRGVIDALRPRTQTLWKSLPLRERQRFLRHVRPFWESHRHRVPPDAWRKLERLRADGRLELIPGRLRDFVEDPNGVTAILDPRRRPGPCKLRVQKVFNCIGPESNFRQHFNDPLLINLLARGVLHPDPLLLGLEATDDFEPIGAAGRIFSQISLIGPPLRGMLWETTAIPEIRAQGARIAAHALRHYLHPAWEI